MVNASAGSHPFRGGRAALRVPVLWWSLVANLVATFVAALLVSEELIEDHAADLVIPLALLVIPLVGVLLAARRVPGHGGSYDGGRGGSGRGDAADVVLRAAGLAPLISALAVPHVGISVLVYSVRPEVVDLTFGSIAVCLLGGLILMLMLLMVGGTLAFAKTAPLGPGWLMRWSLGLLLALIVLLAVGLANGTGHGGRHIFSLVLGLLGANGVVSSAWLWVARASALGIVALVMVIFRAARRPPARAASDAVPGEKR